MTRASASARGTTRASTPTSGCNSPARVAATRIQPITRTDAETSPTSANPTPSMTTALRTEDALSRSTAFRGGAAIGAYGTGVADEDRVIKADLDWRSVAVFLAGLVALIAFIGLVRGAGRPLTWIAIGTLLALSLDPLVSRLEARVGRRSVAVGTVLAGFLVAVVALVALFGPPAARQ